MLSRLDEPTLQKIALETGGRYVRSVTGDVDLEQIYSQGIKAVLEDQELESQRRQRWEDRFQWLLAVALIALMAEPLIAERRRPTRRQGDAAAALLGSAGYDLDTLRTRARSPEFEAFELQDIFVHSLQLLQPQAEMKGNILRLDMHNHLPRYVSGDSSRLRQVLLNLITNAIKFTNDGNITVTVSGETQEAGKFMFECSVRDTGSGIGDDAQETLFDEFTMADQTHSRTQEGTGLGLAICKQLVELMGGTIDFTSKLNQGSIFTFRIPLKIAEGRAVTAEESPQSAVTPRRDTRVLLAEDNVANHCSGFGFHFSDYHHNLVLDNSAAFCFRYQPRGTDLGHMGSDSV